jgi:hypothetical protein
MSFVERIKLTDGTEVASVDANNRLEVAEPNTAAIKTAVEIIDNAISGNEMQVDVVAALPAGTNNIGDVDVLTVPAPLSTTGGGTEATALRVTLANDSTGLISIDDNGGSITVDGTVASTQSGTWNINNVSGTVSLPTGASTSANQSTIITALQLLDNAVATDGSAAVTGLFQVGGTDGTNAQILSTNATGHLNIADGGNSITVDGTFWQATQPVSIAASVAVTDNSGSLTVDAPVGTPVFVRLSDGTSAISTLPVSLASVPSHPVTNAGTFAVQAAQSGTWNVNNVSGTVSLPTGASTSSNQSTIITALQLLDDAILTDNAGFTDGTTKLNMSGYIFDETAGTALTENDAAAARIDAKRAQIGIIEDATTRGRYTTVTAANALKVDGSAVTQPVSGTFWQATQPVSIAAAVAVTDNSSSLTVDAPVGSPVFVRLSDGTSAISTLPVSLATVPSHPVTNAGTFAVQVDGAALTSLQLLDDVVATDGSAALTKLYQVGGTDGTNAQILSTNASGHLNIADGGNSITVDGTVATTQSGTWSTRTQDGSGNNLTSATRGTERALSVQIVDASGNQITAFSGSGTQYTEDVASTGGESLTLSGAIRQDTPSSTTSLDGDYTNLKTDSVGRLWVNNSGVTQPVSGTVTANLAAGTNNIGDVDVLTLPALPTGSNTIGAVNQAGTWNITNVSGTVSLPTGAATSANQSTIITALQLLDNAVATDGSAAVTGLFQVGGTDGTNAQILSTNASGHLNIADGGNSITVDGTVAATQSGTWNIGSITTLPSLAAGTNYIGKTRLTDGTTDAEVVPLAGYNAQAVAIVDGSGNQITSFGGGTQYTEGDTDATITGTALMFETNTGTSALGVVNETNRLPVINRSELYDTPGDFYLNASALHYYDGTEWVTAGDSFPLPVKVTVGTVTHDNVANLQLVAAGAYASTSAPTAVAVGDAVRLWATTSGALNIADGGSTISVDDGGGTLTVDGTVAATQSGTWNITNVSGTVSLPTGASTAANQSTIITAVQLLDDVVVTDNAGFTDGTTKLSMNGFIFDEVAGTALTENDAAAARIDAKRSQVHTLEDGATRGRYATVTAANALKVDGSAVTQPVSGTVTANLAAGTNNIGDVDVLTVPAPLSTSGNGTAATALRVTLASDSTGVVAATQSGTWSTRTQDGAGNNLTSATRGSERALSVQIVDGSGNQVTSFGGGSGGTQYTEDAASAGGESLTLAGAIRQDTPASSTSLDGDYANLKTDSVGRLWVNNSGVTQPVSGTVTANLAAGTNNIGDVDVLTIPAPLSTTGGGTEATALRVTLANDSTGLVSVDDNGSSLTVDNTALTNLNSAIAIIGDSTLPTKFVTVGGLFGSGETRVITFSDDGELIVTGNLVVQGTHSHDSIAGSNPLFVGGYASSTTPTAVANGDLCRIWTTTAGAVNVADGGSTLSIDDGAGSITVDGTVAATQSGTWNITNVSGTVSLPTGAATSANQSTIITALQLLDDTVVTDNAGFTDGTTKLAMSGYIFDEVAGTALTENDAAAGRINTNRAQVGVIEDGATRARYATVTAANALKVDGSAVTQPVSGTVTANLAAGTNNIGDVDVLTVPAPLSTSGNGTAATALRVTVASDSTGTIAATQSGTWNVRTQDGSGNALTSASRGSERALSVQIVNAAGAQVTSFGGGTQYTEDATSAGGESLTLAGTVRQDSLATSTSNDGDFATLKTDTLGRLYVNASGLDLTLAANSTINLTQIGNTSVVNGGTAGTLAVGGIQNHGVAVSNNRPILIGGVVSSSPPFGEADGDVARVWMSPNGAVNVTHPAFGEDSGTAPTSVIMIGAVDGTDSRSLVAGPNGSLKTDGSVEHDAIDAGSPVKIGAKAIAHGTNPTQVAAADRTNLYANRHGILWTIGGHPNTISRTTYIADATGAQTGASIVGTIAAGTKVVVTSVTVTVDSAVTAAGGVAVKLAFSTTTTLPADSSTGANGIILDHKGIAAGSGVSIGNGGGVIGIGADDEELRLTCEDPVGGGLSVTVTYYTIES